MNCEEARMWAMALADGELPPAEAARIEEHLAGCPACQAASEALVWLGEALDRQRRGPVEADIWAAVVERLEPDRTRALWWLPAALLLFKLIEFLPGHAAPWWVQLIPLAAAAAVFAALGVNPFQVNSGLCAERESES